jgi:hypothetical protein
VSKEMNEPSTTDIEQDIHGHSVDWFLQQLVCLTNGAGLEMGITLVLGGSVVSGTLISGKKYFDSFASNFSSMLPNGSKKEEMRQLLASHGNLYDDEGEHLQLPQYIHLSNARVYSPNGGNIPTNGMLWRGKINAVSGFNLGVLSSGDA